MGGGSGLYLICACAEVQGIGLAPAIGLPQTPGAFLLLYAVGLADETPNDFASNTFARWIARRR